VLRVVCYIGGGPWAHHGMKSRSCGALYEHGGGGECGSTSQRFQVHSVQLQPAVSQFVGKRKKFIKQYALYGVWITRESTVLLSPSLRTTSDTSSIEDFATRHCGTGIVLVPRAEHVLTRSSGLSTFSELKAGHRDLTMHVRSQNPTSPYRTLRRSACGVAGEHLVEHHLFPSRQPGGMEAARAEVE